VKTVRSICKRMKCRYSCEDGSCTMWCDIVPETIDNDAQCAMINCGKCEIVKTVNKRCPYLTEMAVSQ
jgi:hypothetical protein